MKKIISLVMVICLLLLTGCSISKKIVSRNLDTYVSDCESIENASDFMPDVADLGSYSQIKYSYQKTCYSKFMSFYSDGLALFVKYDEATYTAQKEKTLQSYTFFNEPSEGVFSVCEFEYRGYNMKIVTEPDNPDNFDCGAFMMIGFDEDNSQIVYLFYYDFDIDAIAGKGQDPVVEMCKLIDEAFAWETFS